MERKKKENLKAMIRKEISHLSKQLMNDELRSNFRNYLWEDNLLLVKPFIKTLKIVQAMKTFH